MADVAAVLRAVEVDAAREVIDLLLGLAHVVRQDRGAKHAPAAGHGHAVDELRAGVEDPWDRYVRWMSESYAVSR